MIYVFNTCAGDLFSSDVLSNITQNVRMKIDDYAVFQAYDEFLETVKTTATAAN